MIGILSIAKKTLRPSGFKHSSYAAKSLCFFSTDESTETGTVKFYNRSKMYGFITSDKDQQDYFVHRTGIVGSTAEHTYVPYLINDEKVKFAKSVGENGKVAAHDVTYEDGSNVPLYRPEYIEKQKSHLKKNFGKTVYDILSEGGEGTDQKITDAFTAVQKEIADLEAALSSSDSK